MSFFFVNFGKDQKQIFNSDCKNRVLLDKIREACGYMECDVIDLASQKGHCMMLHQKEFEYATQCGIENRGTYILCQVENANSEDPTFKSLLETDAGKKLEITNPNKQKKKK